MDLIFAIQANDLLSFEWTPSRPKRSAYNVAQDYDRLSQGAPLSPAD
jgi:hypothetical protein